MTGNADLLRRAAAKLRERAELAQPGPWHIGNAVDPTKPCNVHTFPTSRLVAAEVPWLDAEYIATLHPPVALALADLLDGAADHADFAERIGLMASGLVRQFNGLARAVLREPEEKP